MRILDVSPRLVWPPDNGSSARMYHLLSELSRDHEIRQFSQPRFLEVRQRHFAAEVWPTRSYQEYRNQSLIAAAASEWCHRSWIRPQAVFSGACLRLTRPAPLREWLRWADVALVEFPWQFAYCRRAAPTLPMVLASHNVEVLTRTSSARAAGIPVGRSPLLRFVRRLEQHAVAHADLILAVSEDDRREYVRRYGVDAGRVVTVPNGTDTEALFPLEPETKRALRAKLGLPDQRTVVYLAAGPKVPDTEGLKWVRRVARGQQDLTFLIVGGISARPYIEGNIIATGLVADHRPYLQAADISLSPIQYGGGTKIKVLDGLAAGLATVAFAETIHGTALRDGEHVILTEKSDAALERAIRRLVDEPALANALATAGRRFVCDRHDWKAIARRLHSILVDFVRGARATA
jgi:polysaccharide biosynthesis protein PslH